MSDRCAAPNRSPWVDRPADLQSPLEGEVSADVAVVGGGYMGLSAALRLRESGCDVVLLEHDFCGAGASGRNAGHLTPTIGKDVYTCIRQWGQKRGIELARFADAAVQHTAHLIRTLPIDCDYVESGNVVVGLHPRHDRDLWDAAQVLQNAGLPAQWLDRNALRARGIPAAFTSGVLEPAGGHLHPGKYVLGLRARALSAGVRIFEGSAARRIESGRRLRVHTDAGVVVADQAFVATNAYAAPAPLRTRRWILPLRVSLFRTSRLDGAQLARLGWGGREGLYTAHEVMESYRLSADDRIVGGSKWVSYQIPGARGGDSPEVERRRFDALLTRRFPEIGDVSIDDCWSGWIGATVDHLPIVSRPGSNVHYALGCNGHGIALASYIGSAMGERIAGGMRPGLEVLERRVLPVPTEALRRLAFQIVVTPLRRRDTRIDREIDRNASAVRAARTSGADA